MSRAALLDERLRERGEGVSVGRPVGDRPQGQPAGRFGRRGWLGGKWEQDSTISGRSGAAGLSMCHIVAKGVDGHSSDEGLSVGDFTLQVAEGGALMKLKQVGESRESVPKRGVIREFTGKSRQRLIEALLRIDRRVVLDGHIAFVTLTYPAEFGTARESKRDLKTLVDRFEREYGERAIFWKLEPQKRGAPHYHLLVFMGGEWDEVELQRWMARAWFEVCDTGDERHFRAGTSVERIRSWSGVASYAGKYLGKVCKAEGWEFPGRFWGIFRSKLLPRDLVDDGLSQVDGEKLRRCMRRCMHAGVYGDALVVLPRKVVMSGSSVAKRKFVVKLPRVRTSCEYTVALSVLESFACEHGGYVWRRRYRRVHRSSGGATCFVSAATAYRMLDWCRSG